MLIIDKIIKKITLTVYVLFFSALSFSQCDWGVNPITNSLSCYGDCNGRIEFFITQGTIPYSYQWEDGDVSAIRGNLCGGNYNITITDDGVCDTVINVVVAEPDEMLVTITGENSWCEEDKAYINLDISGGTNPYVFQWQIGLATQNISGLSSGEYNVQIKDSRSCVAVASTSVTSIERLELTYDKIDDICNLLGGIQFQYTGGTDPVTYFFDGSLKNTTSFDQLDAGEYILEIQDVNNCTDSAHITIVEFACVDPIPDKAFTPNGDGNNDTWNIENIDQYPNASITVFDRWGQIVLDKRGGYNPVWRGNNNSKDLPSGAYYYVLHKDGDNESAGIITGSVSIVR